MCTAVTYKTNDHYFGRNLDFEFSYNEKIVITPRDFKFVFKNGSEMKTHYAMIGMAAVEEEYPLYFDAVNEKGVAMAGLLFAGNAVYKPYADDKDNMAPFEFIPWILGQCDDIDGVKRLLKRINITDVNFNDKLPNTPMHWMISDKNSSVTVEAVADGVKVYDNPVGVLTNNPAFDIQMLNLNNYMHLSPREPINTFSDELELATYSRGMGGIGLPGDLSSMSRFVRAAFVRANSVSGKGEEESVSQFFHILGSVEQQRGCTITKEGKCEITIYSSCCNTDKGLYYYKTYENSGISCVDMYKEKLDGKELVCYELITKPIIEMQN